MEWSTPENSATQIRGLALMPTAASCIPAREPAAGLVLGTRALRFPCFAGTGSSTATKHVPPASMPEDAGCRLVPYRVVLSQGRGLRHALWGQRHVFILHPRAIVIAVARERGAIMNAGDIEIRKS